jgi:signal-transduction protein with cAMP-binding, CBS, and nucleotidyltransferase domain
MRCLSCGYENAPDIDLCEVCQEPVQSADLGNPDRELAEAISNEPLSVLNPVPALAVTLTTSVAEAIRLLAARNIGCVLVTSGEKLVGIFSERDALMRIGNHYHEVANRPVSEFMSPDPQTLTLSDSIAFALNRMDVNDFRHIPVEEDGRVVGIISVRDCLAYLTQHFPEFKNHTN